MTPLARIARLSAAFLGSNLARAAIGFGLSFALARGLEARVQDAADLRLRVAHGVESFTIARSPLRYARLSEVNTSQKFSHDQNICAPDYFRPKW